VQSGARVDRVGKAIDGIVSTGSVDALSGDRYRADVFLNLWDGLEIYRPRSFLLRGRQRHRATLLIEGFLEAIADLFVYDPYPCAPGLMRYWAALGPVGYCTGLACPIRALSVVEGPFPCMCWVLVSRRRRVCCFAGWVKMTGSVDFYEGSFATILQEVIVEAGASAIGDIWRGQNNGPRASLVTVTWQPDGRLACFAAAGDGLLWRLFRDGMAQISR